MAAPCGVEAVVPLMVIGVAMAAMQALPTAAVAPCGLELAVAATVAIFTVSMAALGDAKSTAMTSTVKEVRRSLELVPLAAGLAMAVLEAVMATNAPGVKVAKWAIGANRLFLSTIR